jgi:hypothetical protein
MPKLLVFAPCERVIIAQDDNNPTLIAILTSITVSPPEERAAPPAGPSATPFAALRWSIFSMWQREPGERLDEHHQVVEVIAPGDGKVLLSSTHPITFSETARTHRITLNLGGFPVHAAGEYIIRLSLGTEQVAEFPLLLKIEERAPAASPLT